MRWLKLGRRLRDGWVGARPARNEPRIARYRELRVLLRVGRFWDVDVDLCDVLSKSLRRGDERATYMVRLRRARLYAHPTLDDGRDQQSNCNPNDCFFDNATPRSQDAAFTVRVTTVRDVPVERAAN